MSKDEKKPATIEDLFTQAIALLIQNNMLLTQQNQILMTVVAQAAGVKPIVPAGIVAQGGSEVRAATKTEEKPTEPKAEEKSDKPSPEAIKAEEKKPSGKKASPEDMLEEVKKLIPDLARLTSRDNVVEILKSFGVEKATQVPVEKLPEFVATLRAAVKKAS